MQKLFSSGWKVFGVLTGLAFMMRIFSFFPSVIDHDETTYILIADALRQGQVYLRDVIDTKPIGIFVLFAIFQTLFGKTIVVIRIITTVWIALTGWMLYLAHRQFLGGTSIQGYNPAPVASGIIYVFITSFFTAYGVSPNTELFFNLFTVTALFLMLRYKQAAWYFLAGLLLGTGFMIKYVVLFDAMALGLFFVWRQVTVGKAWSFWLIRCILMGAGFLIPFLTAWVYYRQLGLEDTFWFFSFELNSRYFIDPPRHASLIYVLESLLRFFPVTIWFLFCLWKWRITGPSLPVLGLLWGVFVMIIILIPGRLFPHYFIQFMLPLSLLAGGFFDVRHSPGRALSWMRKTSIGYPLLFLIILINLVYQKKGYYDKKDYPREIASYLNTRLQPGDILYTGEYHPVIYLLTGTSSPTPYIHRSLIWAPKNSYALKIDQAEELNKIMQQNPRFILMNYPLTEVNPLYHDLQKSYSLAKTFGQKVTVYERK